MKLLQNIKQKVKTRKIIIGLIVFLITLVLCIIIFHNWDNLKSIIFGS